VTTWAVAWAAFAWAAFAFAHTKRMFNHMMIK
jgi:hypothetical protein